MTTVPISTTRAFRPTTRVGSRPVRSRAVVVLARLRRRASSPRRKTSRGTFTTPRTASRLSSRRTSRIPRSAAVGLGGAVVLGFAFGVWRIDQNKKKEQAYWIEKGREGKAKESGTMRAAGRRRTTRPKKPSSTSTPSKRAKAKPRDRHGDRRVVTFRATRARVPLKRIRGSTRRPPPSPRSVAVVSLSAVLEDLLDSSELDVELRDHVLAHLLLQIVDLLVREASLHGTVGDAEAVGRESLLRVFELVDQLHLLL